MALVTRMGLAPTSLAQRLHTGNLSAYVKSGHYMLAGGSVLIGCVFSRCSAKQSGLYQCLPIINYRARKESDTGSIPYDGEAVFLCAALTLSDNCIIQLELCRLISVCFSYLFLFSQRFQDCTAFFDKIGVLFLYSGRRRAVNQPPKIIFVYLQPGFSKRFHSAFSDVPVSLLRLIRMFSSRLSPLSPGVYRTRVENGADPLRTRLPHFNKTGYTHRAFVIMHVTRPRISSPGSTRPGQPGQTLFQTPPFAIWPSRDSAGGGTRTHTSLRSKGLQSFASSVLCQQKADDGNRTCIARLEV